MEKRRAQRTGSGAISRACASFQQGDEPRDVCWTATARRGRLIARTYQPERSQTVWLVIDAGRLMRARRGRETSLDVAVNAAFAVAQVASGAGDRVGLLVYGRAVQQRLPPGHGPAHLRAMLESLALARGETSEAAHAAAVAAVRGARETALLGDRQEISRLIQFHRLRPSMLRHDLHRQRDRRRSQDTRDHAQVQNQPHHRHDDVSGQPSPGRVCAIFVRNQGP